MKLVKCRNVSKYSFWTCTKINYLRLRTCLCTCINFQKHQTCTFLISSNFSCSSGIGAITSMILPNVDEIFFCKPSSYFFFVCVCAFFVCVCMYILNLYMVLKNILSVVFLFMFLFNVFIHSFLLFFF